TKLAAYAWFQIPVVTAGYTLAGYPEEVQNGLFLVPPGNPQALADLIWWLYENPSLRQAAAITLQEFARRQLTWDFIARNILGIMAPS
ncbi:MAG: hypothetical protein WAU47_02525, partial [Desulfobaccales bacterium]